MSEILLIYPQLGSWDDVFRDIPLSLIYAATESVKKNHDVKIIDMRLYGSDWQQVIDRVVQNDCLLVGFSVMTGNPIGTSLRISKYIKEKYGIPIVWGGPHPTILPEQTLENPYIDFVIRDWGSKALCQLIEHLKGGSVDKDDILGLGYKEDGIIRLNHPQYCFEILDFRDIPYQLVEISVRNYNRLKEDALVFPIYTSIGCPYSCNFCMSPAVYKKIKGKKWVGFDINYILDHIVYLSKQYEISGFQIYDDDSFVDLDRMYDLLSKYITKGFNKKFKLYFRGVRIDHLDRMDEDYFRLLVEAGVKLMFIGVESGSSRILKLMNKGITVEQIIKVNRNLAKYRSLKPHYNFFCGIPGEDIESLNETKHLLLQLVKDNPNCYLGYGAHWKPIPGSVLTEVAVQDYGLKLPSNLKEWVAVDTIETKAPIYPWYTPKIYKMIDLLGVASMFIDAKVKDLTCNFGVVLGRLLWFFAFLYMPFLRLRLKYNFIGLMIESTLKSTFVRNIGKLLSPKSPN